MTLRGRRSHSIYWTRNNGIDAHASEIRCQSNILCKSAFGTMVIVGADVWDSNQMDLIKRSMFEKDGSANRKKLSTLLAQYEVPRFY
jgi:hypothetical protein